MRWTWGLATFVCLWIVGTVAFLGRDHASVTASAETNGVSNGSLNWEDKASLDMGRLVRAARYTVNDEKLAGLQGFEAKVGIREDLVQKLGTSSQEILATFSNHLRAKGIKIIQGSPYQVWLDVNSVASGIGQAYHVRIIVSENGVLHRRGDHFISSASDIWGDGFIGICDLRSRSMDAEIRGVTERLVSIFANAYLTSNKK